MADESDNQGGDAAADAVLVPNEPTHEIAGKGGIDIQGYGPWALFRRLLRAAGSLPLAVLLIGLYIIVLASATMVEKWDGPEAAHFTVYGTRWFTAIHWAAGRQRALRHADPLPWRRRQTGFLVTHVGILVLLAGCLATKYRGVEAQLPIFEGHANRMSASEPERSGPRLQVYLHQFQRKLDPGGDMASHYSSLVDFLDLGDPPKKLPENVLITLNAPVDFTDPRIRPDVSAVSGRVSRAVAARRPGVRSADAGQDRRPRPDVLSRAERELRSGPRAEIRRLPDDRRRHFACVFAEGNDTFSSRRNGGSWADRADVPSVAKQPIADVPSAVKRLNGGSAILLFLILAFSAEYAAGKIARNWIGAHGGTCRCSARGGWPRWIRSPARPSRRSAAAPTDAHTDDGAPRKFTAAELLFGWLAEPEKWENEPFLTAEDEQLREEVLGLPLYDDKGRRLHYASPAEVENSAELGRRWAELQKRADAEGKDFRLSASTRRSRLWSMPTASTGC